MKEKKEGTTEQIQTLKSKLEKAVKEENYELAAELRDKIKEIEKQSPLL